MYRHVAVNASGYDFVFQGAVLPTTLRFMTFQAARGKRRGITLTLMHVVTSGAHKIGRRLITPAPLQKRNLIAMNIHRSVWVRLVATVLFIQRLPGKI